MQNTTEQAKRAIAEQLWLHYFNRYLYENSIISEFNRNKMTAKINSRGSSSSTREKK